MKAMKQLLIVVALMSCNTMLMATQYKLYQTSPATYRSIGSNGAGSTSIIGNGVHSASMPVSNISAGAAKPSFNFHSTSVMSTSGSTLPSAASTGCILTDNQNGNNSPRGPRKAKGEGDDAPPDPNGPMENPLGDTPWLLMLLLALGYALRVGKKYGHRLPDAGK